MTWYYVELACLDTPQLRVDLPVEVEDPFDPTRIVYAARAKCRDLFPMHTFALSKVEKIDTPPGPLESKLCIVRIANKNH